jgi:hypothetical protein
MLGIHTFAVICSPAQICSYTLLGNMLPSVRGSFTRVYIFGIAPESEGAALSATPAGLNLFGMKSRAVNGTTLGQGGASVLRLILGVS